jgi:hypothetical protein
MSVSLLEQPVDDRLLVRLLIQTDSYANSISFFEFDMRVGHCRRLACIAARRHCEPNRISLEEAVLHIKELFAPPHRAVVSSVLRAIACLRIIIDTMPQLNGVA